MDVLYYNICLYPHIISDEHIWGALAIRSRIRPKNQTDPPNWRRSLAPRRWHRTIPRFALSQWLRGGLRTSWTSWTSGTSLKFFSKKTEDFGRSPLPLFHPLSFFSTSLVSSVIVWSFESFFQHSFYPFLIIVNHSYPFLIILIDFPWFSSFRRIGATFAAFLQRNALREAHARLCGVQVITLVKIYQHSSYGKLIWI